MLARRFAVAVLAVAALLGLPTPSSATGISFVESTYGLNFGCTTNCQSDGLSNFLTTIVTTSLLSFSQTFVNGTATTTFTAQAQSDYGSLHASASADYSRSPTATDSRFVYASSIYRELMTVNSATLDGQAGTLTLTFHLDGTISEGGGGSGLAYVGLQAGSVTNPEAYGEQFFPFESSFDGFISLSVPIVYGQEFLFSAVLGTFAGSIQFCAPAIQGTPSCPVGVVGYAATGVGSGSASYFNTLQLVGLNPTAGTEFVSDARFTSDSGTQYGFTGVVPEPGSFVLLGTGIVLGALRVQRRRRRRSRLATD